MDSQTVLCPFRRELCYIPYLSHAVLLLSELRELIIPDTITFTVVANMDVVADEDFEGHEASGRYEYSISSPITECCKEWHREYPLRWVATIILMNPYNLTKVKLAYAFPRACEEVVTNALRNIFPNMTKKKITWVKKFFKIAMIDYNLWSTCRGSVLRYDDMDYFDAFGRYHSPVRQHIRIPNEMFAHMNECSWKDPSGSGDKYYALPDMVGALSVTHSFSDIVEGFRLLPGYNYDFGDYDTENTYSWQHKLTIDCDIRPFSAKGCLVCRGYTNNPIMHAIGFKYRVCSTCEPIYKREFPHGLMISGFGLFDSPSDQ